MSDTNSQLQPLLEPGQMLPAFTLPGADGMPHSPWIYKQREHLLLLFTQSIDESETRGVLRAFGKEYRTFREEECALLAITPDTVFANLHAQEALKLPFPLLADPQGEVIAKYTQWDKDKRKAAPSIVLADRYGAVYRQWTTEKEADLVSVEEILEDLRYMNNLCAL
jgi:peroxiredoxin